MKKLSALFALLAMITQATAQSLGVLPSPNWQPGTAARNLGFTPMSPANNLSDITNPAQARINLGLYTAGLNNDSVVNHGASGSNQSTTGTMIVNSNQATVASPIDFVPGQGARVMGAGLSNIAAPVGVTGLTVQGTAGTTTYQYEICSLGYNGSMSTCVSASTSTGPNPITTTSGLTYYGSTQNYVQVGISPGANSSGWVVYRGINGGTPILWTVGTSTVFNDQGIGWTSNGTYSGTWVGPNWLPAAYPTTAINDWFVGTITAISGNILTFSASTAPGALGFASNTVISANVYHDDTSAFNNAFLANSANGGNIQVPCGIFNLSFAVTMLANYVGFTGQGMCSEIVESGTGYDWNLPNTNVTNEQRGNFVQNMYIIDRYKTTGFVVNATNTYNITFSNLQIDFPPFGFNFLNNNTITLLNIVANSGTRGVASTWMRFASDAVNAGCCLNAYGVYDHGNGVYAGISTSFGGTDKIGYSFDGNFATAYGVGMAVSNVEGIGFDIFNDTGNTAPPNYLQFIWASSEFSTGRAINIAGPSGGAGPSKVLFADSTISGAQNGNANIVVDGTSAGFEFTGGTIVNAGCRGVDIFGTDVSLVSVLIGNNSSAGTGGTAGTCDGVVLEVSSRGTTVSSNRIGDPFNPTVQHYPVSIVNGADYFNINGNTFYGNVTNCVNNGSTSGTSRIVANNAGSC